MDKKEIFLNGLDGYNNFIGAANINILYFIKQAVLKNSNLSLLINNFNTAGNDTKRMDYLEQILIILTGAGNIQANSAINFINEKRLFVLEYLDKLSLISFSINYKSKNYSEQEIADIVDREFESLKLEVYAKLMQELYLNMHFPDNGNDTLLNKVDNMMKEELKNSSFNFYKEIVDNKITK